MVLIVEKNKMLYITLVLVICLVLTGLGAFYLGTKFGKKEIVNNNKDNKNVDTSYIEELLNMDINDLTKMGLYNYSESGKSSLKEYFDSLNNNQKLDLAGLSFGSKNIFSDLKQNLIDTYGNDFGLEAKDYMLDNNVPVFIYDAANDKFVFNESSGGTDVVTNQGDVSLYNYRLKNIQKDGNNYIVSYYGLYETNMYGLGPAWLTNNKNIDRPNVDNPIDYGENDNTPIDYYLANIFNNNKNDFLIFDYTFNEKNGNYYIVDFKVR